MRNEFLMLGEYAAAGLYEETKRSLFYRKSLGLRRFYENCVLAAYNGESLYPSGRTEQKMNVIPSYIAGLTLNSPRLNEEAPHLAKAIKKEFGIYRSTVPVEHTVAGNMYTHSMPNYERILKEGLLSYKARIEKISDRDMREGLLHIVLGIECYITRCIEYLTSIGAEQKLIEALKRVPLYPAKTAYEAIVAWNFIMYLDNCDNLGCLGKGLLPYFKNENLIPYLENLYDNLDKNNGYSMSIDSDCPELAIQCLKLPKKARRCPWGIIL